MRWRRGCIPSLVMRPAARGSESRRGGAREEVAIVMYPVEPPAEPQRNNIWQDTAPTPSSEPTRPNLVPPPVPPRQPTETYDASWPARYPEPAPLPERQRWFTAVRVRQIIYFLLSVLETLLVIRFFLKLLGANPDAWFTIFIYGVTEIFVAPFEGVFPSPQTRGSMLDFATLLAMIVYALLAWMISGAIETLSRRAARPV